MDVPVYAWIAVVAAICAFLAVDLFVLHRDAHEVSVREAALTSAAWVTLGLSFTAVVWWVWGGNRAGEYVAGYLIEKSLSVDNIFVIALLLAYFAVPPKYHHRVLFWGVVGALVLRAAFIFAGAAFLDAAHWAIYVFGALLVVSAPGRAMPAAHLLAAHGARQVYVTTIPAAGALPQPMPFAETGELAG